jgi:hypothetical protein
MTEYMELKAMGNGKTSDDKGALHPSENGLEAAKPTPTPPIEEDPYTLTAYGDISLSDIDFVPGPPSEISPSQMTKKKERWRFPRNDSEKMVRLCVSFSISTIQHAMNSRRAFRALRTEFDHRRSRKDGPRKRI